MHANIQAPDLKVKTAAVKELAQNIGDLLKQRFGDGIVSSEIIYDFPTFTIERTLVDDVLHFLYNDTALSFRFLTTICGLHYPEQKGAELGVMYQLHNMEKIGVFA